MRKKFKVQSSRFKVGFLLPQALLLLTFNFGLSTTLFANTSSKNPTSDEAVSGTWDGTANSRWTVVDDHPDSAGTDALTHGTTAGDLTFGFTAFAVPAGATALSVQVIYYDQKTAAQAAAAAGRLKVGGSYFNATTHNPANGTWTLRTDNWATNPKTAAAWTVNDVNGVGANALQAFGFFSNDASPTVKFSSVIVQVTYTPPGGRRGQTLVAMNVRGGRTPRHHAQRGRINKRFQVGARLPTGQSTGLCGAAEWSKLSFKCETRRTSCQTLTQQKSIRGRASCG